MIAFYRKSTIGPGTIIMSRIISVALALLVGGFLFAGVGYDVIGLAGNVITESFGSVFGIEDVGLLLAPLLLTGLAAAVALRIGLWNIGGEGQFYAGAIAATLVGLHINAPGWLALAAMAAAAIAGGMLWVIVPAIARSFFAVDEIITTLLLNFVATLLIGYLCTGPMRDASQSVTGASARIPYEVPPLLDDLHWGLGVAIILVLLVAILFARTVWGYEVRIAGSNPHAAIYAGIPVRRRIMQVFLLSGGIAGLAGMLEVAGTVHRLEGGISNNFGYLGIVVAALASGSPLAVLPAALLMALLLNAGVILQSTGVSPFQVLALTGFMLFAAAIGERVAYWRPRRSLR